MLINRPKNTSCLETLLFTINMTQQMLISDYLNDYSTHQHPPLLPLNIVRYQSLIHNNNGYNNLEQYLIFYCVAHYSQRVYILFLFSCIVNMRIFFAWHLLRWTIHAMNSFAVWCLLWLIVCKIGVWNSCEIGIWWVKSSIGIRFYLVHGVYCI